MAREHRQVNCCSNAVSGDLPGEARAYPVRVRAKASEGASDLSSHRMERRARVQIPHPSWPLRTHSDPSNRRVCAPLSLFLSTLVWFGFVFEDNCPENQSRRAPMSFTGDTTFLSGQLRVA